MGLAPLDDAAIAAACGHETFRRGLDYARSGRVRQVTWSESGNTLSALVQGNRPHPYLVGISTSTTDSGQEILVGHCTCPMSLMCKHVAAALIIGREGGTDGSRALAPTSTWRRAIESIVQPEIGLDHAPMALQLTVQPPLKSDAYANGRKRYRLGARPMLMGAKGRWVNSGVSWHQLRYLRQAANPDHVRIATRMLSLHPSTSFSYYGGNAQWLDLAEIDGQALWSVLQDARRTGMPLIIEDKAQSPVSFIDEPAQVALDVIRTRSGLDITPELWFGEDVMSFPRLEIIGHPGQAAFAWQLDPVNGKANEITLLSLANSIPDDLADLLVAESSIHVPIDEVAEFLLEGYPALARHYRIGSQDASFAPPSPPRPTLHLVIVHHRIRADASWDLQAIGPMIDLQWGWSYSGNETGTTVNQQVQPLRGSGRSGAYRDFSAEQAVLAELDWLIDAQPMLAVPGTHTLAERASLGGRAMIDFLNQDLGDLRERVETIVVERASGSEFINAAYLEAVGEPEIAVRMEQRPGSWDWFDLQVTITIAGEEIPFELLFRALAMDQEVLFLPSGAYVSLDSADHERMERLHALRALIEEARELRDTSREPLGISRYQVDLWNDLIELGVVDDQSARWQQAVSQLVTGEAYQPDPLPVDAILAEPRPYQSEGYAWLSYLRAHGLGGVLADDMGLGKTLQAIMTMVHGRQDGDAPYLVVAPTSVMGNWARECARFAPSLSTELITETSQRRGQPLAETVSGFDVVITSYALLRLGSEEFEALEWSGLWLDEAQFVKNRQSQAYGCARRLRTPFKVAITGTPLENNLMELWSLLSITAPGLFPNPDRFAEYYQRPIEREQDAERLALLRRRIRPFMLRRTKEEVASDLPPKQEQVLELDLHPKHQKVYQRHLQRERQKVLGLIGDLRKHRFEIFKSLTMLRQLSLDASLIDESYANIPSTKLDALVEMLEDIVAEGHRTLVFSQFTGYLAKVRTRLSSAGIQAAYLDGRTRKRDEAIDAFVSGSAPVFLISLKAGGFGLNLTAADYVILLDPWWNPATEAQAIDRTHRIGQSKKVMVYRMVARDTIEERVMALKEHKAALFDAVMTGTSATGAALTADDIRELLG